MSGGDNVLHHQGTEGSPPASGQETREKPDVGSDLGESLFLCPTLFITFMSRSRSLSPRHDRFRSSRRRSRSPLMAPRRGPSPRRGRSADRLPARDSRDSTPTRYPCLERFPVLNIVMTNPSGMRVQGTHQALQRSHVAAIMMKRVSAFAAIFASLTMALMPWCLKTLVER